MKKIQIAIVTNEGENSSRGDLQGARGIASAIGNLQAIEKIEITSGLLSEVYGDSGDYAAKLKRYFDENGAPDMLFATQELLSDKFNFLSGPNYRKTLVRRETNETYALRSQGVETVPHHITPELLDIEGQKFAQHYSDISGELVAIMYISQWRRERAILIRKMMSQMPRDREMTFFICTCGRTLSGEVNDYRAELQESIERYGLSIKVKLFDFNEERKQAVAYNPYAGLIANADHFLMLGTSRSIMSEILARGKTVHTDYAKAGRLYEDGFVHDVNETLAKGIGFQTRDVSPPDITQRIARQVLRDYSIKKRTLIGHYARKAASFIMK